MEIVQMKWKIVQMSNIFTRLNYCYFNYSRGTMCSSWTDNSSNGSSSNEIAMVYHLSTYANLLYSTFDLLARVYTAAKLTCVLTVTLGPL